MVEVVAQRVREEERVVEALVEEANAPPAVVVPQVRGIPAEPGPRPVVTIPDPAAVVLELLVRGIHRTRPPALAERGF